MRKTLLIVDDEQSILNSLNRLFRQSPYVVITTSSAQEALRIIEEQPIAVLLSDFCMPHMTGAKLLAKARNLQPNMIRLVLSGNNDQSAVIESVNEGCAHRYLTKPWEDKQLRAEIEWAFAQYQSSLYVDGITGLLTTPQLTIATAELLSISDAPHTAIAFSFPRAEPYSSEEAHNLHLKVSEGIQSTLSLDQENFAFGLLEPGKFFLCIPSSEIPLPAVDDLLNSLITKVQEGESGYSQGFRSSHTFATRQDSAEDILQDCLISLNIAMRTASIHSLKHDPSFRRDLNRKSTLESLLFSAIDRNELYLNYQPKILTRSGELCGAEALLRWDNAKLGSVSPMEFIPLSEQNGLIQPIGHWVMTQAIQQWTQWFGNTQSKHRVSINISPVQLENQQFLPALHKVLSELPMGTDNIEFEITETCLMQNSTLMHETLQEIQALGIHLSIDDFGTGFSSLSYLSRLPIDTIKIDRSFILPMLEQKKSESMVKNIIAMARDLEKETVAEGVETQQQLELLSSLGCDVIQGYLFSKPLGADEFHSQFIGDQSIENTSRLTKQVADRKAS